MIDEQTEKNVREFFKNLPSEYLEIGDISGDDMESGGKNKTTKRFCKAGDILVLSNGEYVVVEKVQHEILEAPVGNDKQ